MSFLPYHDKTEKYLVWAINACVYIAIAILITAVILIIIAEAQTTHTVTLEASDWKNDPLINWWVGYYVAQGDSVGDTTLVDYDTTDSYGEYDLDLYTSEYLIYAFPIWGDSTDTSYSRKAFQKKEQIVIVRNDSVFAENVVGTLVGTISAADSAAVAAYSYTASVCTTWLDLTVPDLIDTFDALRAADNAKISYGAASDSLDLLRSALDDTASAIRGDFPTDVANADYADSSGTANDADVADSSIVTGWSHIASTCTTAQRADDFDVSGNFYADGDSFYVDIGTHVAIAGSLFQIQYFSPPQAGYFIGLGGEPAKGSIVNIPYPSLERHIKFARSNPSLAINIASGSIPDGYIDVRGADASTLFRVSNTNDVVAISVDDGPAHNALNIWDTSESFYGYDDYVDSSAGAFIATPYDAWMEDTDEIDTTTYPVLILGQKLGYEDGLQTHRGIIEFSLGRYDSVKSPHTKLDITMSDRKLLGENYRDSMNTVMTLEARGRMGINTSEPTAALHVESSNNSLAAIFDGEVSLDDTIHGGKDTSATDPIVHSCFPWEGCVGPPYQDSLAGPYLHIHTPVYFHDLMLYKGDKGLRAVGATPVGMGNGGIGIGEDAYWDSTGLHLEQDDTLKIGAAQISASNTQIKVGKELLISNPETDTSGYDVNFYGAMDGSRLFWDASKMALRAGMEKNNGWANDSTGQYSMGLGYGIKSSGSYAVALGHYARAIGPVAIAAGEYPAASGSYSVAIGNHPTASGIAAVSLGDYTVAAGDRSTAMGRYSEANATNAFSAGYLTKANGIKSIALGTNTTASRIYSMAIGKWLSADSSNTMLLGSGISDADRLKNNTPYSLQVAFNDTTATLFVGGSNHRVGIRTKAPTEQLEVNGNAKCDTLFGVADTAVTAKAWTSSTAKADTNDAYLYRQALTITRPSVSSTQKQGDTDTPFWVPADTFFIDRVCLTSYIGASADLEWWIYDMDDNVIWQDSLENLSSWGRSDTTSAGLSYNTIYPDGGFWIQFTESGTDPQNVTLIVEGYYINP